MRPDPNYALLLLLVAILVSGCVPMIGHDGLVAGKTVPPRYFGDWGCVGDSGDLAEIVEVSHGDQGTVMHAWLSGILGRSGRLPLDPFLVYTRPIDSDSDLIVAVPTEIGAVNSATKAVVVPAQDAPVLVLLLVVRWQGDAFSARKIESDPRAPDFTNAVEALGWTRFTTLDGHRFATGDDAFIDFVIAHIDVLEKRFGGQATRYERVSPSVIGAKSASVAAPVLDGRSAP